MTNKVKQLLEGKCVKFSYEELIELLKYQNDNFINTLMIQQSRNCYYVIVDDITVQYYNKLKE